MRLSEVFSKTELVSEQGEPLLSLLDLGGQLVFALLRLLQLHHLFALFQHLIALLFDELDLACQLDLSLAQVVQGLFLDLNQLLNLRGE